MSKWQLVRDLALAVEILARFFFYDNQRIRFDNSQVETSRVAGGWRCARQENGRNQRVEGRWVTTKNVATIVRDTFSKWKGNDGQN